MELAVTQILLATAGLLITYFLTRWLKDPIRKIPGPPGLPILGNILHLDTENLHNQFFRLARQYGAVMKIRIFTVPVVVLNSKEACLEALTKTGTDFQGRPPLKRLLEILPKDIVFLSMTEEQVMMRRIFYKAMKAYGPGIDHLENVMQESLRDMVDSIDQKGNQAIDTVNLSVGYVCCVIAAMLFGEKHSYDSEVCQQMSRVNEELVAAIDPFTSGGAIDAVPFLFHFKFLFRESHKMLDSATKTVNDFISTTIQEIKAGHDPNQKRGCVDYFLEVQRQELSKDGTPLISDDHLKGLLLNFITAGLETSRRSLSQIFLDLLHDPALQKKLQAEVDGQFEPAYTITLKDREKLPQVESYLLEHFRYLTQVPLMVPHMTIRDTKVAGYKVPANTVVIMNSFYTAHDPDVYDEPFKVKPERFLDENGQLVDRDHPYRENFLGFGAGRRACPGEVLAKSRIFLFLVNILQKYTVELAGELPDRDVRNYPMSILLTPPSVKVRFVRRQ
ncbi:cytochrome P450 2B5-like [Watersipora subatra]|uniref:cytochrome P450 2B5-like n=1 Tax=Watersipora subatra TaxID=2589382 RepID=UPI00355B4CCA